MAQSSVLSELAKLRGVLRASKSIIVLSGAGVSAESGIPTFRSAGGFWRTYKSQDLATAGAFKRSPSLVWEFYHYRRELVLTKQPNKAHLAIAQAEEVLSREGKRLTVITQNVDGLHQRAGSKNVIELHGSLFKTRCLKCNDITSNFDSPICPSLLGRGAPDTNDPLPEIKEEDLPRCKKNNCGGLLRPHIVWFGENLDQGVLQKTEDELAECDACLIVGTSSVVYPAALYGPALASRNVPVAEFNLETTPATHHFMFHFPGPCTESVPSALSEIIDYSNVTDGEVKEKVITLTAREKLKQAVKDYGSTVIVFHITISLMSLGAFYLAVSSGLDVGWLVSAVGLGEKMSGLAAGASTFVIAYSIHKVFAPVRISITLGATPFIVRHLRKIGFLKPPSPK